jgi:antitoxin CptB
MAYRPGMFDDSPGPSLHNREARLKRLKYRAWHRGFKEADLILGPFADAYADAMDEALLEDFEALLQAPDQDLYDWILERAGPEPAFDGPALQAVRAYVAGLKAR